MLNPNLFTTPASNVYLVINYVFVIFFSDWKTFVAISFLQVISMISLFLFFGIVVALCWFGSLYSTMQNMEQRLFNWNSFGSSFLIGSFSGRLLGQQGNYYDQGYYDYDTYKEPEWNSIGDYMDHYGIHIDPEYLEKFGWGILVFSGFILLLFTMIISIFKGALVRASAVTYAGHNASTSESINIGREKCLSLFGFNFFLGLASFLASLLFVDLPATLSDNNLQVFIPSIIALVVFDILLNSTMIGGGPSIVVEGRSVSEAIKRSLHLYKTSMFLIFSTCFSFAVLEIILFFIFETIGWNFYGFVYLFYLAIKSIVFVAMIALNSIMVVVLYMSIRIKLEGCTQQDLVAELKLAMATPLVEMIETEPTIKADLP